MKILVVNTTPFGPGGITRVIMTYYSKILTNDMVFDIVAINEDMPEQYKNIFEKGNSPVYCLPRRSNLRKYITGLYSICHKNHYDIVHIHGNSGTMLIETSIAVICKIPKRIVHCHNVEHGHKLLNKIINPVFRMQYTKALACSYDAGNWLFGKGDFSVLNNAIDLENYKFSPQQRKNIRAELGFEEKDIVLVHVGYFNEQKNQQFLIKLMNKLSDSNNIKLLLIGNGKKLESIKKSVSDNRIHFLGSSNRINVLLQAADCFVFPSKWEGLGIVLIEAQASGLPCIVSTNVPRAVNITNTLSFIDLNDINNWLKCIKGISIKNATERYKCSSSNIEKLTQAGYDINTESEKLVQIYKTV